MATESSDPKNFITPFGPGAVVVSTIPFSATIQPRTFVTKVTGTGTIQTIIPPTELMHLLVIMVPDGAEFGNSGNLVSAYLFPDTVKPYLFLYDPYIKKYYQLSHA